MQCPRCQHENPGGKFCGECGARLELHCAACGEPNPPGNKFCQECGERMAAAPIAAKPAAPSPVAYTPQHLAERIIPFFESHDLKTLKRQDFLAFRDVVRMMRGGAHLTDAGLEEIARLKGRTFLSVTGTQVTEAGLKKIRNLLPKCQIYK